MNYSENQLCHSGEHRAQSCADCGRLVFSRRRLFDHHTGSEVDLCGSCLPAFLQRQQFPPGCCDGGAFGV